MEKSKFGKSQLNNASPKWVVPTVSSLIVLIAVAQLAISGDPSLADVFKIKTINYLNALSILIAGIAPFWGVVIKSSNPEE
jgi:hypothetical protein